MPLGPRMVAALPPAPSIGKGLLGPALPTLLGVGVRGPTTLLCQPRFSGPAVLVFSPMRESPFPEGPGGIAVPQTNETSAPPLPVRHEQQ